MKKTHDELLEYYEQLKMEADRVEATAPLACVYTAFIEDLRALAETSSDNGDRASGSVPDRMLRAPEVAERLGIERRTVYKNADGWPFTRRYPGGSVRFSERGLDRWLERQR